MISSEKLYSLGCGSEMVRCQQERGTIQAIINNNTMWVKHNKYAFKNGLYDADTFMAKMTHCLNELKSIEYLVQKFSALYMEQYSKLKLQIEKIITNQ